MLYIYNMLGKRKNNQNLEGKTVSDDERNYTIRTKINKPAAVVFDAVVSSGTIIKYFVDATNQAHLTAELLP